MRGRQLEGTERAAQKVMSADKSRLSWALIEQKMGVVITSLTFLFARDQAELLETAANLSANDNSNFFSYSVELEGMTKYLMVLNDWSRGKLIQAPGHAIQS